MNIIPLTNSLESLDLTTSAGVIDALSVIDLALADLDQLGEVTNH